MIPLLIRFKYLNVHVSKVPVTEMKIMSTKTRKPKILTFVVLVLAGLLSLGHIGATLAFTGPATPIKTSLQPGLNKYFLGPLDQGWGLFAPGPYSQNEFFMVRGCLSEPEICAGGQLRGAEFSEWRNVTEEESEEQAGNIFANRESKQSRVIHGRVWSAAADLPTKPKEMLGNPYVLGEPTFGVELNSDEALEQFSSSELSKMRSYQRLEDVAVGFASLYAIEQWGGASMVEIKLLRTSVTPFAQRHNPPEEPTSTTTYLGWRDTMTFDEETMSAWS